MPLPLMQVDAFTNHPLGGNPCAVVFDADHLTPATMQAIAQEMNLSETAFVMKSSRADFRVRYFTPAEEIPMAGHPTIATTFALVTAGRLRLTEAVTTITLEMPAGLIPVAIHQTDGEIEQIVMTQNKPAFLQIHRAEEVMPAFGLSPDDVLPGASIQTVSTGTPQLMIPLINHDALRRAVLDIPVYGRLREKSDFFSPHLFCLQGATEAGQTFARHFGTPPDTMEDPFTGSATGGMASYLWHHGLLDATSFVAEQGHWMNRPGTATVTCVGTPAQLEGVNVGGQAALVFSGQLML
ncbi:MAG: PhzF family phenazine biosynthesis protein [Bacteroidota bacterium]